MLVWFSTSDSETLKNLCGLRRDRRDLVAEPKEWSDDDQDEEPRSSDGRDSAVLHSLSENSRKRPSGLQKISSREGVRFAQAMISRALRRVVGLWRELAVLYLTPAQYEWAGVEWYCWRDDPSLTGWEFVRWGNRLDTAEVRQVLARFTCAACQGVLLSSVAPWGVG